VGGRNGGTLHKSPVARKADTGKCTKTTLKDGIVEPTARDCKPKKKPRGGGTETRGHNHLWINAIWKLRSVRE